MAFSIYVHSVYIGPGWRNLCICDRIVTVLNLHNLSVMDLYTSVLKIENAMSF